MKKYIGFVIARIGARLWEKGGFWNESERYEDLKASGKLGYKLFCKGLLIAGITEKEINQIHT